MKGNQLYKIISTLFIVACFLFSSVTFAAADQEIDVNIFDSTKTNIYEVLSENQDYIWNNSFNYEGLIASQIDDINTFDAISADDFVFSNDTFISEIDWIGGYWNINYSQGDFNWEIIFYEDRGDGMAPGEKLAGPYNYTQSQCNPVIVEDTGSVIYYLFSRELPENVLFNASEKYWVSINGIGPLFPQSGIAHHQNPINLHQAVFKSNYFGYNDWNNTEYVLGTANDLCFRLLEKKDTEDPVIKIEKPVKGIYLFNKKVLPRIFGLPIIIGDIKIKTNASDDLGVKKVEFYAGLMGNIYLGNVTKYPYEFIWEKDRIRLIHLNQLKVVVYDYQGNTSSDKILLRKFL